MKEIVNVSATFTVFGNINRLINRIDRVKDVLSDFKCKETKETLSNGLPSSTFIFSAKNRAVILRSFRLDIQYGYRDSSETNDQEFLEFVDSIIKKLSEFVENKFNRISYSNVAFIEKDDDVMNKFNDTFGIKNVFGSNAQELQVRLNHVTEVSNESVNAVVLVQDGFISRKSQTEAPKRESVVFINNDINTVISNREQRFTFDMAEKIITDFVMLAKERTNKVVEKL